MFNFSGKDLFKKTLFVLTSIIISCLLGVFLLSIVYLLPIDPIENNVRESSIIFNQEGMYPKLFDWCTSKLDNSTDSIMMLEAANRSYEPLINRVMLMYRGNVGGQVPFYSLIERYINNKQFNGVDTYARYWHGYLVILKPLLFIMNYGSIRILNGLMQLIVNCIVIYLLYKNNYKEYIIAYIISILMLMPIALAYSLQFSSCFYLFSLTNIAVLYFSKKEDFNNYWIIFLFSGILTAYFDFLTYPMAVVSIPLVLYLIIKRNDNLITKLINVISNGFVWCISYVSMWASKWVLSSIFTNENVIADGINSLVQRTQNYIVDINSSINTFEVIGKNMSKFFTTPFTVLFILYIIYSLFMIISKKKSFDYKVAFSFLLMSLIPFAWYILAVNHSAIHEYFTCKTLVISVFALMCMFTCSSSEDKSL